MKLSALFSGDSLVTSSCSHLASRFRHLQFCHRCVPLLSVLFLWSGAAWGATILFQDDFSGTGVGLNGLSPDVTTGGVTWVSSPVFSANGGIASAAPGSATLAFTPKANHVYTLDASFRNMAAGPDAATPNENDWFALGFASGQSTGSTTNDRFLSGNVVGQAWSLVRGSTTTNGNNNAFLGSTTSGTASGAARTSLANAYAGDMDVRVVLDTSITNGGNWNAAWYAKRPTDSAYVLVRDTTPLLSAAINSVGIAKSNTGVTGAISSFSLSEEAGQTGVPPVEPFIHKSTIGQAYGLNTINGTSFSRNNLVTFGDQQFAAYYEPDKAADDGFDGNVVIARRTIGSETWQLSETSFLSNNITDTHDVISIAVDGNGIMHMSWGMHAKPGGRHQLRPLHRVGADARVAHRLHRECGAGRAHRQ